jgi:hypothetical protein
MEKLKLYTIVIAITFMLFAINNMKGQSFDQLDKSPHDIAYFNNHGGSNPEIKVVYGRPEAKDEVIFGTQVPFGEVWGTGSNEATEVKFYHDTMFGNKYVKAGTYVLYTIPNENYWTIILSSRTDTYGSHFYNEKNNIAKIEVPAGKGAMLKNFSIAFLAKSYGSQMVLGWGKTRVKIPLYTEQSLITKL